MFGNMEQIPEHRENEGYRCVVVILGFDVFMYSNFPVLSLTSFCSLVYFLDTLKRENKLRKLYLSPEILLLLRSLPRRL